MTEQQKRFMPYPVMLTDNGKALINHSENFRKSEQIYIMGPADVNGRIPVACDKEGSVFTYMDNTREFFSYKPMPIEISENARKTLDNTLNFRNTKTLYMVKPPNAIGMIPVTPNPGVIEPIQMPAADITCPSLESYADREKDFASAVESMTQEDAALKME